ncbi:MAG: hypothetical protein GVY36_07635 [Verrucomicrobia bacterium]|jgi:hypothetical protein|nr:hypothetical protein [Verrucomicrobiota bacterium]
MKLLVIPDLHENLDFLKYILAVEDTANFDHVILLGDYFDRRDDASSTPDDLVRVAETLLGIKKILGDKLHLLCGNHDLPYYALRPVCGDFSGSPNRTIGHWMEVTTCERAEAINSVWDANFWRQLKGAVLLDGWLFSHAGMDARWWPQAGKSPEDRMKHFARNWQEAFETIYREAENPLFSVGRARGGTSDVGGPLWLDWDAEFEDNLDVPQIAGHTRCARQNQKGRSYCIDMAQAAYAVVEDGEVQLRIWPDSWLGDSLSKSV